MDDIDIVIWEKFIAVTARSDSTLLLRTSMSQILGHAEMRPLQRQLTLELRWLSGRAHHLGLHCGVPTPGHSAVYRALVLHELGEAT